MLRLSNILAMCLRINCNQLSNFQTNWGLHMSISFNSSLSGIRAATDMLNVSAHNTANMNTDGYKKYHVSLNEGAHNRVIVDISRSDESGSFYKNEDGDIIETSNVSYPDELAVQINAKHLLSANAAVIKRTAEAQESLMDILA